MSPLPEQLQVPADFHGERFDVALAKLLPDYSRSLIKSWIIEGNVVLNHQVVKPRDKVKSSDFIHFKIHELKTREDLSILRPENIPLDVIYEDDDLMIINKPAGLVVHPGAGNYSHTLVNALLHYNQTLNVLPRAGIIHRLDKDTTGLLIVAKNNISFLKLTEQMANREIDRKYLALVHGEMVIGGELTTYFGRSSQNRLKMAVKSGGKLAITHYQIEEKFLGLTLLNVKLFTGRTHQIRVHMAHIHHPIIGDQLYGGRSRIPGGISPEIQTTIKQFKRQALHAYQLNLLHPITQEPLTFIAPMPEDFESLLQLLKHHA